MEPEDIVREPVVDGYPYYAGTSCTTSQISSHTATFGARKMIEPGASMICLDLDDQNKGCRDIT